MKLIPIHQRDYHNHGFDKSKLPNIAAAGYISASLISKIRNPIRFLTMGETKTTDAMEWGNIVDCLYTTPELFAQFYKVLPQDAPKKPTSAQLEAKKPAPKTVEQINWWMTFEREAEGKTVLDYETYSKAQIAVKMLESHPVAAQIKHNSIKQAVLMGDAPPLLGLPPGSKCKGMMDFLPTSGSFADAITDLKTTNDLSDNLLHNTMFTFDYVPKLAFYKIIAEAAGYGPRNRAVMIWSRSSAPYDVVTREVSSNDLMFGQQIIMKRLEKLKAMTPNNIDPYLEKDVKPMKLHEWAINAYLNE